MRVLQRRLALAITYLFLFLTIFSISFVFFSLVVGGFKLATSLIIPDKVPSFYYYVASSVILSAIATIVVVMKAKIQTPSK